MKETTGIFFLFLVFNDSFFRIEVKEAGDYQLCFDNRFSYQARKVVFFEIFLFDEFGNVEEEDISKYAKFNSNLQNSLQELGMTALQFQVFIFKNF